MTNENPLDLNDRQIFSKFKRTLKEDNMWPYIQRQIMKDCGSYRNLLNRVKNSSGWGGVLHRTDILSFPFLKSESRFMSDREWYEYWVRKSDKWRTFCTGKKVVTDISYPF